MLAPRGVIPGHEHRHGGAAGDGFRRGADEAVKKLIVFPGPAHDDEIYQIRAFTDYLGDDTRLQACFTGNALLLAELPGIGQRGLAPFLQQH